jgi:alkanesulfonate monooxygenase SsuD/methylene tetrahydromethanopterin reductase-like flavin-dependent oxidoreductase (luciferase family)
MPRLSDEPEIIKFVRIDSVQYEHEWDPDAYDPYRAKQVIDDYLDEAEEAERLGWDGYFVTEHHFDGWTLVPQPNIFLAALAMRTSRMRLGQGVQVLPVHNPVWLAEQYGMLDLLSGGRLEVGLGRGNFEFEWDRYAEDHADAPRLFDENLLLLRKALTECGFSHDGPRYAVRGPSTVYPRPLQTPLPTWIAAVTPGSVERVGRMGFNLAGPGIPDGAERLERYVESAAAHGYEVSGANFIIIGSIICAPTDREAELIQARNKTTMVEALAARGVRDDTPLGRQVVAGFADGIAGSPLTVRHRLIDLLQSTGARRMMCIIRVRGLPGEVSRQTQQLLAEEVFPHVRGIATPGFDALPAPAVAA